MEATVSQTQLTAYADVDVSCRCALANLAKVTRAFHEKEERSVVARAHEVDQVADPVSPVAPSQVIVRELTELGLRVGGR